MALNLILKAPAKTVWGGGSNEKSPPDDEFLAIYIERAV